MDPYSSESLLYGKKITAQKQVTSTQILVTESQLLLVWSYPDCNSYILAVEVYILVHAANNL